MSCAIRFTPRVWACSSMDARTSCGAVRLPCAATCAMRGSGCALGFKAIFENHFFSEAGMARSSKALWIVNAMTEGYGHADRCVRLAKQLTARVDTAAYAN